ncbi:hypothetical protein BVRB_1g008040 [Beta vulgaris subsp. vulgaris]|nr:hypothetical protein BVRB_1g008040 [Beta vulgaris subsp. vulgaris]
MARKTGDSGKKVVKPTGPTSDSQALKTRSIDEVMGIEALDFGLGDVLTPKSSIRSLQQQLEVRLRHTFNAWLDSLHKT